MTITGTVVDGFGSAAHDVATGVYGDLGYEPYPGTLNLRVDPSAIDRLGSPKRTVESRGIERRLWPVRINGIDGHAMNPHGSGTNGENLELLAPVRLREWCSTGDTLTVEVA